MSEGQHTHRKNNSITFCTDTSEISLHWQYVLIFCTDTSEISLDWQYVLTFCTDTSEISLDWQTVLTVCTDTSERDWFHDIQVKSVYTDSKYDADTAYKNILLRGDSTAKKLNSDLQIRYSVL